MHRFCCLIAILLGLFAIRRIQSATYREDGAAKFHSICSRCSGVNVVEDLVDVQKLVESSNLNLRGWRKDMDPCGEIVPCGINHLDECNWEGVACAIEEGTVYRVIGIAIEGQPGQELHGRLPIKLPGGLQSISLPYNALYGDLSDPECTEAELGCSDIWWRNTQLRSVNLDGNALEGPLPEWKTLDLLERVRLSDNRLNGTLPIEWSQKIHLQRIELSRNVLEGHLPEEWSKLFELHYIRLAQNRLRLEIPVSWLGLRSLLLLDVSGNCAICGHVPEHHDIAVYGNGTNLNIDCERCNDCNCQRGELKFVLTNVLLSITALAVLLFFWVLYRCFRTQNQTEPPLPITDYFPHPVPRKPTENPTIVINPDHDVCICCQVDNTTRPGSQTEESSATSSNESISDGDDSSDYSVSSDSESIDPRVLAFLYKTSPMLAVADRSWSEEIGGIILLLLNHAVADSSTDLGTSEMRQEGYASDMDARSNSSSLKLRRSKSALGGFSQKNVSKDFMESRKSAKLIAELAPTPKQPRNKHRRRRVRTFRRKNRRGLAGDFTISEPQASLRIPKEFDKLVAGITSPLPTAQGQPSGSGGNNEQ